MIIVDAIWMIDLELCNEKLESNEKLKESFLQIIKKMMNLDFIKTDLLEQVLEPQLLEDLDIMDASYLSRSIRIYNTKE